MTFRFADVSLLDLGPPPDIASSAFETRLAEANNRFVIEMSKLGILYDVQNLETDPVVIQNQDAVYRDTLRRRAIDDAVAETYLGSARGLMLDQRAADYGVLRRIVQFADPLTGEPEILEDDDSLRLRARLAWEGLSVAGPLGAYVFHALDAHPMAFDAMAYGPETDLVQPGEVLVVVQSRDENGAPSPGVVDAVAARLDAYETIYSDGSSALRPIRDEQSVRPLGARVTVMGARPRYYTVTATLYVPAQGDREVVRQAAVANLTAYMNSRRRIGRRVPKSGLEAALALVSPGGIPVVDDVDVVEGDLIPSHTEIPVPGEVNVTVEVR